MRREGQQRLTIVPTTYKAACEYIRQFHRHHLPSQGCKFALAVADESGAIRGVAVAGRPVARKADDGFTLEVVRVATDGCPNACSALYGAVRRVAAAMGYRKVITYILDTEPGTSLKAAGFACYGRSAGGTWSRPSRGRDDKHPTQGKFRWDSECA